MITSEVQRTLVKSPPELWTELSDPESLARHLAELGEIKITRVDPEKLVEWEAPDTTGSVAIKASGWGTKVTLTVKRELPASLEESSLTDESDLASSMESEPADDPPIAAAAEAEPESPAAAGESESDPKPAPATEAARRAAGWPAAKPDPVPAIESDLRAAEATASTSATAHGDLTPWHIDTPAPVQSEPSGPVVPSTEPRRGFLARLFGGRRRKQAEEPQLEQVAPSPRLADELLTAVAIAEPEMDEAPEPRAPEPSVSEPILVREPVAEAEPVAEPVCEAEPIIETKPVAEPVAENDPPAEYESAAGKDLAAELRAAEETAEEQVKAVLTGVLDRLGAAHHRPFSRA